jgi:Uma2 family endonuclease
VYFTGDQIILAAEILSPSSRAYNRILKRKLYAEARVPYYLVVDPAEPTPSASLSRLLGEDYREVARSIDGLLRIEHPSRSR